jgi:hypothetical protein
MSRWRYIVLLITASMLAFRCSSDPASSNVIASEQWRITDSDPQNYADLMLSKLDNGAVTASGKWIYEFFGYLITCTFMSGSATIVDSSVSIIASGNAAYPPDSSGQADSSAFTLQMNGSFKAGAAKGAWEIHFADTLWEGWIDPGTFTGTLQSGSGVTAAGP